MFRLVPVVMLLLSLSLVGCEREKGSSEAEPAGKTPVTSTSSAGMVEKLDLPALAAQADAVLVGSVTELSSRWLADGSQIVTDVRVAVQEVVAPAALALTEARLLVPGGTVGDVSQSAEDVAQLERGATYLLFLVDAGEGAYSVAGGWQGAQAIEGALVQAWELSLDEAVTQIRALKP